MSQAAGDGASEGGGSGTVSLFWWTGEPNLGDRISPLLVSHFLGGRGIRLVDRDFRGKLLACGSIIHTAARDGDTVWGSGMIAADMPVPAARGLCIRAVRGPRTARALVEAGYDCPDVFGDPGLLMPAVYPMGDAAPSHALGVIPHFVDKSLLTVSDPEVLVLDIQAPVEDFLRDLWRCHRVISSALHGIILAEAYGIPADWLQLSNNLVGGSYKFCDYYEGTGRDCPEPLRPGDMYCERPWIPPRFDAERLRRALSFQ